ncbi:protein of unknown function [Methylotuvimicrobium alcaliphilum 20Z]|uniref:Uncharacterized protein n=1 Tax=Methylotuvimicrobium alcaliphilum (strain DSM 19304 / NCIMB 14124 / VKM B-2133 / 20Z) TaxID=1091494 RepID=G4SWA6_META2|nr:protein of unknown function [Methylotuvimicrobium alcaliphilum 20Z]
MKNKKLIQPNVHESPAITPANESTRRGEGAVTRPTGRREYVHVGSMAAILPPTPVDRATAPSPEPALPEQRFVYRKIR